MIEYTRAGATTGHFTNGLTYTLLGMGDSTGRFLDDNNQLTNVSFTDLNDISLWTLVIVVAEAQLYP